jgi:hypothetical protein
MAIDYTATKLTLTGGDVMETNELGATVWLPDRNSEGFQLPLTPRDSSRGSPAMPGCAATTMDSSSCVPPNIPLV